MKMHYFAYGSNMHPLRLAQRVPSSSPLGTAELAGYRLRFHKVGGDGSGKCNVHQTGHSDHRVLGIVYELLATEKPLLDKAEGVGFGYQVETRDVRFGDKARNVFFYVAQPSHIDDNLRPFDWYKDLVLAGARTHGLPGHYVSELVGVSAIADPDSSRTRLHRDILAGATTR